MPKDDRIAVIGIGCHFPGGSEGWEKYWDYLISGKDGMQKVPSDRWDWRKNSALSKPSPSGKTFLKEGGFLEGDIFAFDPKFFGISQKEAETLDPQQRLLLEVTYQALEDAGKGFQSDESAAMGVFIGGFSMDNFVLRNRSENKHDIEPTDILGFSMTLLANRLSYAFNWTGPSFAIDTACSSSLVAVHQACQSLLNGECTSAIAGGVNAMIMPEASMMMSRGGFLSPTCRCHTFDSAADGYARGEGAGVVLLKPYGKALEDGDRIHAVIRGSGVNHDGKTAGIALPDSQSQKNLMQSVYGKAGIDPAEVDFVEAHGTGTIAGDSAEIESIHQVFNETERRRQNPLIVGSVKTNFGHLEAAAGMAGMIKAILCLKERFVPPHLHLTNPNPRLKLKERAIEIPLKLTPLPSGKRLLAGINSFGYGGTNAHVVLESVEESERADFVVDPEDLRMVSISAHSEASLKALARKSADWLWAQEKKENAAFHWAYTQSCRRKVFPERLILPFKTVDVMAQNLRAFGESGELAPGMSKGRRADANCSEAVFVFTGMGPQWWGMGQDLYRDSVTFREVVDKCETIFHGISGWSIRDAMLTQESESRMRETQVAQPANVILQIALAAMWAKAGVLPAAVIGHSVGEVAAAYVAGALSLEDCIRVAYYRSHLQQKLAGTGRMLAVGLGESSILPWMEKSTPDVCIAAVNSPEAVTLAGPEADLEAFSVLLNEAQIFNRMLQVEIPYHSRFMDSIRNELRQGLSGIEPRPANIPIYSTVTGERLKGEQMQAGYWWNNVRRPVQFEKAFKALLGDEQSLYLEIGPHPVLRRSMQETAQKERAEIKLVASLVRGEPELEQLQASLGQLILNGVSIAWKSQYKGAKLVSLPVYPWQREHIWRETKISKEDHFRSERHIFLQNCMRMPNPAWEVEINGNYFPFVYDHKSGNQIIWPGAAYIEAGLAINLEQFGGRPTTLSHLRFFRMLSCGNDAVPMRLMTTFDARTSHWSIASSDQFDDPDWQFHADGRIFKEPLIQRPSKVDITVWGEPATTTLDPEGYYSRLATAGLRYGPHFQTIKAFQFHGKEAFVTLEMPTSDLELLDEYQIHPTLLDGAFQAFMHFLPEEAAHQTWVPVGVQAIHFFERCGRQIFANIRPICFTENRAIADIRIFDGSGKCMLSLEGITFRALRSRGAKGNTSFYLPQWKLSRMPLMKRDKVAEENWIAVGRCKDWTKALFKELEEKRPSASCHCYQLDGEKFAVSAASEEVLSTVNRCIFIVENENSEEAKNEILNLICLINKIREKRTNLEGFILTLVTRAAHGAGKNIIDLVPANAMISGIAGVVANEYADLTLQSIDLPSQLNEAVLQAWMDELSSELQEEEISLLGSERRVLSWQLSGEENKNTDYQLREFYEKTERAVLREPDDHTLSGLHHVAEARVEPGENEIEIRIHRTGINFKDLLKVTGRIAAAATDDTFFGNTLGMECSGVVLRVGAAVKIFKPGDRVGAFVNSGCFATHAVLDASLAVQIPDNTSIENGACMVPWCTAYYGLIDQARLSPGETILIHSGAGGVGLAAIQIARLCGATVFATASTQAKRDYLLANGAEVVMDSQNLSFSEVILEKTGGVGVDVILNALSGEMLKRSFELLAPCGRFIEIGKRDIIEDQPLSMSVFNRNASFIAIDLDRILIHKPQIIHNALAACWERLADGRLRPLPNETFDADDIEKAFLEMANRERIGRVSVSYESSVSVVDAPKGTKLSSDGCYLITGGTSGLGLEIARHFATEGAGQLVLLSRRGIAAESVRAAVDEMEQAGAIVWAPEVDVSDENSMASLFAEIAEKGWALKGIVHAALVLEDAFLDRITADNLDRVFGPKVLGADNLDKFTQSLDLDFKISFSSVSNLLGNIGQGSYVAANAYLEQLAHKQHLAGKRATTILLGYVADTGVAFRQSGVAAHLERAGLRGMESRQIARQLLTLIDMKQPIIGWFEIDWFAWSATQPKIASWARFQDVLADDPNRQSDSRLMQVREILSSMESSEHFSWLREQLLIHIASITRIKPEEIQTDIPISQLGIDSLMVVELIGTVKRELGVTLGNRDLFNDPSCDELTKSILGYLGFLAE